jgi:hypothetical protein
MDGPQRVQVRSVPVVARQNETMAPRLDPRAAAVPLDVIRTRVLGKVSPREAWVIVRRLAHHEA